MAEGNPAPKGLPQANPEIEGLSGGSDQSTSDILRGYAAANMDSLSPGQKSSPTANEQMFARAKEGITSTHVPNVYIAMADGNTATTAEKAAASEYSPPEPTGDRFLHTEKYTPERGGSPVPIHTWEHVEPTTAQSYDPQTGVIKESYTRRFGIRGSGKLEDDYGGVWFDKQASRTLAHREERITADGKALKEIEFKNLTDTYAYGKVAGITGHRKLDSSKMWQVEGVDKDGKPEIQSFQEGTIWEKPLNPFGKPYLKDKPEPAQRMSNDEFNRRWAETDPKYLERIAARAETGRS